MLILFYNTSQYLLCAWLCCSLSGPGALRWGQGHWRKCSTNIQCGGWRPRAEVLHGQSPAGAARHAEAEETSGLRTSQRAEVQPYLEGTCRVLIVRSILHPNCCALMKITVIQLLYNIVLFSDSWGFNLPGVQRSCQWKVLLWRNKLHIKMVRSEKINCIWVHDVEFL